LGGRHAERERARVVEETYRHSRESQLLKVSRQSKHDILGSGVCEK
jgi:hypothetical protein